MGFVKINSDAYYTAYSKWIIEKYGKAIDEDLLSKFDKFIGLRFTTDHSENDDPNKMCFIVENDKRYMLSCIKYEFC